jgi:predicted dehydrogenase
LRQLAQQASSGDLVVVDVPSPVVHPGWVLVALSHSLISVGTERKKVKFAEQSLFAKARARPDLVRKVVDAARVEGVRSAAAAARERLAALGPLGYSGAGVVLEVGGGVEGLQPGDSVACGGAGWANHAELVSVPKNLVAQLPPAVRLEDAAYATVAAIGLHAVHQAQAEMGQCIGVLGLGLVGQLTSRLLRAAGCRVVGIDIDPEAVRRALAGGATAAGPPNDESLASALEVSRSSGLDAVIVCAASESPAPVEYAASLLRDRGKIVIVGDVPVQLDRSSMYDKELEIRIARSYGPGRYSRQYEERGRDLPIGYVRWTEQRNIAAVLDLIASGHLRVDDLTTHRYPLERAPEAFGVLTSVTGASRPCGVLLEYTSPIDGRRAPAAERTMGRLVGASIGVIGAGTFARRTLMPALTQAGASIDYVAGAGGLSSIDAARRTTPAPQAVEPAALLASPVHGVVIATRHDSHAAFVEAALAAGKSVFVEKPVALTEAELSRIAAAERMNPGFLMIGFNRRYAPFAVRAQEAITAQKKTILVRVAAGPLPVDHWLNDVEVGGGRLIGEGCHFIDLMCFLAGARVRSVRAFGAAPPEQPVEGVEDFVVVLEFENGSTGTLVYFSTGGRGVPKERIEIHGGATSAIIDDWRELRVVGPSGSTTTKARQDKGHRFMAALFVDALNGRARVPSSADVLHSSAVTIEAAATLLRGPAAPK